jgi:hypothetical protein
MKIFLTNFMRKNRHLELYPPELLNTTFSPTVKIAHEALGRATFRPQRALNASVTDAILAGTAKRLALGPITDNAAYKAAIEAAISSATFADLYKVGTTNKDKVTGRIGRIADALLGVH